jgi:hypothetical protein
MNIIQIENKLKQLVFALEEREKHPEQILAQLYNPDKMQEVLRGAQSLKAEALERCYRNAPFNSDEERLEYLLKSSEKMIQEEAERGTLFEVEKKKGEKK